MQRSGYGAQPGLILVLNNQGDAWHGANVRTQWPSRTLIAIAWSGGGAQPDNAQPATMFTNSDGTIDLYAAARGYAIYAPS